MSPVLSAYIIKYGYIAIFLLVFLQEIGVPNRRRSQGEETATAGAPRPDQEVVFGTDW